MLPIFQPGDGTLDSEAVNQMLQHANPLDAASRADALRRRLHGDVTSFTLVRSLDLGASLGYNPINGIDSSTFPSLAGHPVKPEELPSFLIEHAHPAAGDYQLLFPGEVNGRTLAAFAQAAAQAIEELLGDAGESPRPTFQLGTADTWMGVDTSALGAARQAGLRVVSEGIRPVHHPAHGEGMHRLWEAFWRKAADAGLRGNATVLFGPQHNFDSVLWQLEAIAAVQSESGVFLSVAPVVYDPSGFQGADDSLLTQGQFDLRVLSACRLMETGIDHLRMLYARSDLKMAHLGLSCGVDDLEGPLFDEERSPKEVADTFDLSLEEMVRWLEEAGYTPALRNGIFELQPEEFDEA